MFQTCGFPSFQIAYCLSFPFVLKIKSLKTASKREKDISSETNNSPNRKVSFFLFRHYVQRKEVRIFNDNNNYMVCKHHYQKRLHSLFSVSQMLHCCLEYLYLYQFTSLLQKWIYKQSFHWAGHLCASFLRASRDKNSIIRLPQGCVEGSDGEQRGKPRNLLPKHHADVAKFFLHQDYTCTCKLFTLPPKAKYFKP